MIFEIYFNGKHCLLTLLSVITKRLAVFEYKTLFFNVLLSSDRRFNLCKRMRVAAGELYIFQESWIFSSSFFTLLPSIHISFQYFCRFSRHTRTYCINPRVKMSNIEVFMRLWKSSKLDLGCLLSPHISVPSIFKHFLIKLECWNFRCGLGPPFCMRLFVILESKSQIIHLLSDFDEFSNTFSYVFQY